MSAPIIVVATLKGGSGKSTTAAIFACHSQARGKQVALIDADPQGTLLHWHSLGEPALEINLVADTSEDVGHRALKSAGKTDLVVVDTAGFRNRTMIEALLVADFVVVPIKASPLDIAVAMDTVALIKDVGASPERNGKPLPYALVLTQVSSKSALARHVRSELAGLDYDLLKSELVNRVAYGEAALSGRLPLHVSSKGAAAQDGEKLTSEVWDRLARIMKG